MILSCLVPVLIHSLPNSLGTKQTQSLCSHVNPDALEVWTLPLFLSLSTSPLSIYIDPKLNKTLFIRFFTSLLQNPLQH
jgi:hypothetical protein